MIPNYQDIVNANIQEEEAKIPGINSELSLEEQKKKLEEAFYNTEETNWQIHNDILNIFDSSDKAKLDKIYTDMWNAKEGDTTGTYVISQKYIQDVALLEKGKYFVIIQWVVFTKTKKAIYG